MQGAVDEFRYTVNPTQQKVAAVVTTPSWHCENARYVTLQESSGADRNVCMQLQFFVDAFVLWLVHWPFRGLLCRMVPR